MPKVKLPKRSRPASGQPSKPSFVWPILARLLLVVAVAAGLFLLFRPQPSQAPPAVPPVPSVKKNAPLGAKQSVARPKIKARRGLPDSLKMDSIALAKKLGFPPSYAQVWAYHTASLLHSFKSWDLWAKKNFKGSLPGSPLSVRTFVSNGGTHITVYYSPDNTSRVPVEDSVTSLLRRNVLPSRTQLKTLPGQNLDPTQTGPDIWPVMFVFGPRGQAILTGYSSFAKLPAVLSNVR